MAKRSLNEDFLAKFDKGGEFAKVTEMVKYDPSLDFEMRGNSVMLYYRGGKILEIKKNGSLKGLDSKYSNNKKYKVECPIPSMNGMDAYISEAKRLIDKYLIVVRNHLGEKEYQQRIAYENNLSVNAEDGDFFIADIEWADNTQLGGRADIVAFKWGHMEHRKRKVQMVLIEVKQGENSIKSKRSGLQKHYDDYLRFRSQKEYVRKVAEDMIKVLHQKHRLGLVKGLKSLFVDNKLPEIEEEIDFICLLANYKPYSSLLHEVLSKMEDCKLFVASFMGYCLYQDFIVTKDELTKMFPKVKGFNGL